MLLIFEVSALLGLVGLSSESTALVVGERQIRGLTRV